MRASRLFSLFSVHPVLLAGLNDRKVILIILTFFQSDKLCFNGGLCVNTFGSWYCDCPLGYTDPYCMIQDHRCDPNPCLNDASCLDYGSRYECICQNGKGCCLQTEVFELFVKSQYKSPLGIAKYFWTVVLNNHFFRHDKWIN